MLEPAVILLRLAQYGGAMVLFGSSLFCLYAFRRAGPRGVEEQRWPVQLLRGAALALLVGALLGLVAQTAVMAGSLAEGLKPASLGYVVTGTGLGRASLVRAGGAVLSLAVMAALRPGPRLWALVSAFGAIACASLAWMGHAGAAEGPGKELHLLSDVVHALAAAVWVGALAGFTALLLRGRPSGAAASATHQALHDFAGIGSLVVAALIVTGAINSWFLVGPSRLEGLWTSPYGLLLSAKLVLFGAMLALAAANRFRLTPGLRRALDGDRNPSEAIAALRLSILVEAILGWLVLGLVAWLGTLVPIAAQ